VTLSLFGNFEIIIIRAYVMRRRRRRRMETEFHVLDTGLEFYVLCEQEMNWFDIYI
jgi:hypothetical protein